MCDFDERDLVKMLDKAGFGFVHLELDVTLGNAGLMGGKGNVGSYFTIRSQPTRANITRASGNRAHAGRTGTIHRASRAARGAKHWENRPMPGVYHRGEGVKRPANGSD